MKKYIALIALIAVTGCGSYSKDKTAATTETEMTTENTTLIDEETRETITGNSDEDTTQNITANEKNDSETGVNETDNAPASPSFEESSTYNSLKTLASNAGFDISYADNTVTFKAYITDDTIDYIESKDSEYQNKWNENCGLYEEFCSEAVRTVKNNGVNDINIAFEIIGRSDNRVYYRNENGTNIYDAYVHENKL
ncbi:MAG: hypothetical protein Q4D26_03745 [Clostridia bacterium]|nr:hypothetical protein [Clostridia bacterium]